MSDETDIHQPAPPVQPHFKEIDGRLDILERKMKVVMHTQGMDGCGLPGHKAVMGDEGTCYCETCEALAKKPAEPIKHEPNCNDMLFGKPNCTCRNTRPAESCECFYNSEMGQREYCTKHEEEARWPAYPVQPSNLPASEITAHDGIAVGMPVHPAAWMEVAADECARDAFPKSQTDIFKSNNRLLFKKIIAAHAPTPSAPSEKRCSVCGFDMADTQVRCIKCDSYIPAPPAVERLLTYADHLPSCTSRKNSTSGCNCGFCSALDEVKKEKK